ncbi:MAG: hypothetical protein EZS28_034437 [Streblomastix strix]|uniref:OTU domain-containing protein n=1 Tax=Streblomastix strix TaxID=222440 RepID=A0A5J4UGV7_9EUKA|nr:MAG: hypothetical protein EZS28_034437 [Streblomastix strix]
MVSGQISPSKIDVSDMFDQAKCMLQEYCKDVAITLQFLLVIRRFSEDVAHPSDAYDYDQDNQTKHVAASTQLMIRKIYFIRKGEQPKDMRQISPYQLLAPFTGSNERNATSSGSKIRIVQRSGTIQRDAISTCSYRKIRSTISFKKMQEELFNYDRVLLCNRGDGNCIYRSIDHQHHGTNKMHGTIRQAAVKEFIENRLMYDDDFNQETLEQYARKQSQDGEYAEARIYLHTCYALNINLRVHLGAGKEEIADIESDQWAEIAYVNRNHYVIVI